MHDADMIEYFTGISVDLAEIRVNTKIQQLSSKNTADFSAIAGDVSRVNVFTGVSTQCDERGEERVLSELLEEHGYTYHRAKTNLGLGRVTNIQKKQEAVRDEHLASVR